jgi:hypothetical protein
MTLARASPFISVSQSVSGVRRDRLAVGGHRFDLIPAIDDGAVPAVLASDATAELCQILVRVHHAAFHRLSRSRVVAAIVQRYPSAAILIGPLDLRPRHAGYHALKLSLPNADITTRSVRSRKGVARVAQLNIWPTSEGLSPVVIHYPLGGAVPGFFASSNASCRARTASSVYLAATRQLTLISLVEIA